MTTKVFVSYATPDRDFAKKLADEFAHSFLAPRDIPLGDRWLKALSEQLEGSDVIVILHSRSTSDAHYQQEEILEALRLLKKDPGVRRLIPVCLDDTPLQFGIQSFQAIPFSPTITPHDVALELRQRFPRPAWELYDGLLSTWPGYRVAYLPIVNDLGSYRNYRFGDVTVQRTSIPFVLPQEFRNTRILLPPTNDPSCRLVSYKVPPQGKLRIQLSETSYEDYLRSGEHLDDPCPPDGKQTFREAFGALVRDQHGVLRTLPLTNICGVGVFVLTRDGEVLVTRHSRHSHVYPGRWTYSASGVMKFGANPNPFTEIHRKAFEEIRHQSRPEKLELVGFGADARKLFFQFSFVERTEETLQELVGRIPDPDNVRPIELEPNAIAEELVRKCWEPAAEATLLWLASSQYPLTELADAVARLRGEWPRRAMLDEWDYRASRPGELPDMSVRYPRAQLAEVAAAFTEQQMQFLGEEATGKTVLEVGCGTGRLTEKLQKIATKVTCLDLSERMIERARERVGQDRTTVKFVLGFAEDYEPTLFDLVVCSRVLIHNVAEEQFDRIVQMMCRAAALVYVFEDVTPNRPTSPHSVLRPAELIGRAFELNGFSLTKSESYSLSGDLMAFMRFQRRS